MRFSILGLISGLLIGAGGLILLQQYAVVFPTLGMTIGVLVAGVVLGVVLPGLVSVGRRRPAAATAGTATAGSAGAVAAPAASTAAAVTPAEAGAPVVAAETPAAGGFAPTHRVTDAGADAFEGPDAQAPTAHLDPRLEVQRLEEHGDRTRVLCSNGWSAWVRSHDLAALAGNR